MNLHPHSVLTETLADHPKALGLVNGALALAVEYACASWAEKYPPQEVHGGVFAGTVRQAVLWYLQQSQFHLKDFQETDTPLYAHLGPNCSVVLSDFTREVARVRKHPINYKNGELLPITPYPSEITPPPETLFGGHDFKAHPWQPYVVWKANFGTQTLETAWLAAVADFDSSRPIIYDKIELTECIVPITEKRIPSTILAEAENWDKYFEGEGIGDPDPA